MNLKKDIELEQLLVKIQRKLSEVNIVLSDYIYMHSPSLVHICHVRRKRQTFYSVLNRKVSELLIYIKDIQSILCKKEYSQDHLASKVFELQLQAKDYFKCNIQIIYWSIDRQHNEIQKNRESSHYKNNDYLIGKCLFLHDMLYDVSEFFDTLYQVKKKEYEQYLQTEKIEEDQVLFKEKFRQRARKNNTYSANDILRAADQIKNRFLYRDDIVTVPVVIFQMRHIIELRILEILGIAAIVTDEGMFEKITANVFLDMKDFTANVLMPIKKGTLKKIYAWTCVYVHKGISGPYWLIDFMYHYLLDFTIEEAIIRESYSKNLKEKISEYTGIGINNIVMSCRSASKILSDSEFDKAADCIKRKGFRSYKDKERKDEFELLMRKTKDNIE